MALSRRVLMLSLATVPAVSRAGWLDRAEKDRELRIGIDADYPPYSFEKAGAFTGIDVELAREACRRMGCKPVFVALDWKRKNEALAGGRVHCIWSCFSMAGREKKYLWVPYLLSRLVVVVPSDSPVRELSQLAGRIIAVQSSTWPEAYFLKEAEKAPAVSQVLSFPSTAEAFVALRRQVADATAGHEAVMRGLMREVPGSFRVLAEPLKAVTVGVAFSLRTMEGRAAEKLSEALEAMTAEGFVAKTVTRFGLDGSRSVLPKKPAVAAQ